jgi:hypothetical protein
MVVTCRHRRRFRGISIWEYSPVGYLPLPCSGCSTSSFLPRQPRANAQPGHGQPQPPGLAAGFRRAALRATAHCQREARPLHCGIRPRVGGSHCAVARTHGPFLQRRLSPYGQGPGLMFLVFPSALLLRSGDASGSWVAEPLALAGSESRRRQPEESFLVICPVNHPRCDARAVTGRSRRVITRTETTVGRCSTRHVHSRAPKILRQAPDVT